MKTIKISSAVFAMLLTLATWSVAAQPEFNVSWRHMLPDKDEDWSSADGFEAQMRFWNPRGFGLALAMGVDGWTAKDEFYEEGDGLSYFSTSISGSMTAVPVGVSFLHRRRLADELYLTLDAGVRYVFCSSDITVDTEIYDSIGHDLYRDPIDVDNAVVGVFGMMLEGWIGDEVSIQGGFGYQVDLVEPKETFQGKDIGSSSLQAAIFRLGLAWTF